MLYTKYTCPTSPHSSHRTTLLNTKVLNFASLKSIYRPGCQSEWGIGYYRDNLLAQKLLPYIFWISQSGFLSFDGTTPRRIEHATLSLSWSERYSTSFLQQCGRRNHRILTQSTIVYCSRKFTHPELLTWIN